MMDVALGYLLPFLVYLLPSTVLAFSFREVLKLRPHEAWGAALLLAFLWPSLALYPFMVANIPVGPWTVYLGIVVLYTLAAYAFLRHRSPFPLNLPALLIAILFLLTYAVRIQSASSIYSELDPYYYAYSAWMLAEEGIVPYHDDTAWYPQGGSHRTVPFHTALLYTYYTLLGGGNHYALSLAANAYPPLAAAITVVFFFLLAMRLVPLKDLSLKMAGKDLSLKGETLSSIASFLYALSFSFTPYFLMKTFSGVFEVQPYAFALLTASFFLTVAESPLILLALPALALGSVSFSIYFIGFLAYVLWKLLRDPKAPFSAFDKTVAIAVFLSTLSVTLYTLAGISLLAISAGLLAFLHFYDRLYSHIRSPTLVRVAIPIAFALLLISPLGNPFLSFVKGVATVGSYRTALERTIAEQNPSPADLNPILGLWGLSFLQPLWDALAIPLNILLILFSHTISAIFAVPPFFSPKVAGPYVLVMEAFLVTLLYLMLRDPSPKLLVAFALAPTLFVTMFKAKFLIYFAYAIYIASLFPLHLLQRWRGLPFLFSAIALLSLWPVLGPMAEYLSIFPIPKVAFHPSLYSEELALLCQQGLPEACLYPAGGRAWENYKRFSYPLCVATTQLKYGVSSPALGQRCSAIAMPWMDAMAFIESLPEGARVTSWWDYGHWINFFGQRKAVLRNEHNNLTMIYRVAYAYVMDEKEMPKLMADYDSDYLLVDREIVFSSVGFGGKFHALNYLACVYANQTNLSMAPGESECEANNLWETVRIAFPVRECTINPLTGEKGFVVERLFPGEGQWRPYYCLGSATLANGTEISALYYLDRKGPAGELILNRAFLLPVEERDGIPVVFETLYTTDEVWVVNNTVTSGWEDRIGKGHFYDSLLYKAFVLDQLEGFEKVFDNGYVKIYHLEG